MYVCVLLRRARGQIRAALEYVVGEHVGGARSSESETRLIDTVAQALVGEEELANPTKVRQGRDLSPSLSLYLSLLIRKTRFYCSRLSRSCAVRRGGSELPNSLGLAVSECPLGVSLRGACLATGVRYCVTSGKEEGAWAGLVFLVKRRAWVRLVLYPLAACG